MARLLLGARPSRRIVVRAPRSASSPGGPDCPGCTTITPLVWHDDHVLAPGRPRNRTRNRTRRRTRLLALAVLLLVVAPLAVGCVRIRASLTVSPDDQVSGQIIAAAKPRDGDDKGPQLSGDVPFAQKVAISDYNQDGYVGSEAVFSNLSFAELPQLANMNREAAGVDLSLRRAGNLVILEGRVDLTSLNDNDAEVDLTVSFPGEITSTNGDRIDTDVVQWNLKPGIVNTMSAQARVTDPSTRSFTGGALVLAISALLVAGVTGAVAWMARDRSPRFAGSSDDTSA
jgi:hypothetical protein